MPTPTPAGFKLATVGRSEPKDAFDAFTARGLLQPSFRWQDVFQQEHASAFAVAGIAQRDVLQLFRDELDLSLREGRSAAHFAKRIRPALVDKGWWGDVEITDEATGETRIARFDERRLQLIYDVNLRQSHAAGRWARIERNKRRQPFVLYRTMRDERVRASHRAWDSLALPVDDPFWDQHYPPNGWRCRCTAFALSERDIAERIANGEPIRREVPPQPPPIDYVNPRSGEVVKVPPGVDPGFAYNPGKARLRQVAQLQRNALDAARPELASALVREVVQSSNFERFVAAPLADEMLPVAILGAADAAAIGARSRTVMLSAETAAKQAAAHPEITAADYQWAQLAIDAGERIQDGARSVVYVLERNGFVLVVKSTLSGEAVFLTSLRRISMNEARRDAELRRLRAKAIKGADGGAPQ
jgi:SPP1 gp7 family putative phage head morphogenesis protein